jgi:hypothetical protein
MGRLMPSRGIWIRYAGAAGGVAAGSGIGSGVGATVGSGVGVGVGVALGAGDGVFGTATFVTDCSTGAAETPTATMLRRSVERIKGMRNRPPRSPRFTVAFYAKVAHQSKLGAPVNRVR